MLNVGHVSQYLLRAAEEFPELIAIEDGAEQVTYARLAEDASRVAAGLQAHCGPGPVSVALALQEPGAFCAGLFGAWLAGAAAVPIAPDDLCDDALLHCCLQSHVRVLIVSAPLLPRVQRALSQYAHELSVFVFGAAPKHHAYRSYDELLGAGAAHAAAVPPVDSHALTLLQLAYRTSARGVVFSNRQLLAQLRATERLFPVGGGRERIFCPHACGTPVAFSALMASIRDGATFVTQRQFDPAHALLSLRSGGVEAIWSTPLGYRALLDTSVNAVLPALRYAVSLGPLDERLRERVQRAFETGVYESYGPAEAFYAACWSEPGARKPGSVGRLQPGLDMAVLENAPRAADGCGELGLRGSSVAQSYDVEGFEPAACAAFVTGWFCSGDIGRVDDERDVFVSDRKLDTIYRDGEWQSADLIEVPLNALPEVAAACVLRRGDLITGETALAIVELRPDCSLSVNELHQRLARQAIPFLRLPDAYAFVPLIPKTASGKTARGLVARKLACSVAAPNIERAAPGLEPWLFACGLGRTLARSLHELVETRRAEPSFAAAGAQAWTGLIAELFARIAGAHGWLVERGALLDELERLAFFDSDVRGRLDALYEPRDVDPEARWNDRDRNQNTRCVELDLSMSFWSLRLSQLEARLLRSLGEPASLEEPLAARVALITRHELKVSALPADPAQFLVVGRHTQASLRAEAENLSLRHLLLIGRAGENGGPPVAELIPLVSAERVRPWSKPLPPGLAQRCIAFDLGSVLLLVAPELDVASAPTLHQPAVSGLGAPPRRRLAPHSPPRSESRETQHDWTDRTVVTFARELSEVPDAHDGFLPLRLTVSANDRSVSVGLREEWLAQGLILGRKPEKCSHRAFHDVLAEDHISRCHLYLRREGDEIAFYDTASTAGLWIGERCVERIAIAAPRAACEGSGIKGLINPERTVLILTDQVRVTLTAVDAL